MKKILSALVLIAVATTAIAAQSDPFMPPNPKAFGMGGAYTANAEGYNAFFYNPAAFARQGEFTLLSTNVYGVLDKTIYDLANAMLQASAQGKDPMSVLTTFGTSKDASRADSGLTPEQLQALGLDAATLDKFTDSVVALTDFVDQVSAASNGSDALAAGMQAVAEQAQKDPVIAEAFKAAGIDPAAVASGTAGEVSLEALLPALLLVDSDKLGGLVSTFVTTVDANSPVSASPAAVAAGTNMASAMNDAKASLMKLFPSGNLNVGAMLGIGWAGRGLGIGLFANVAAGMYTPIGKTILNSTARANVNLTLAAGLGFNLWDGFSVGVQVRPTIMGYVGFMPATLLTSLLSGDSADPIAMIMSKGIYKGFRLGVDAGVLWDIGDLTLGVALKDIIPNTEIYQKYDDEKAFAADLGNFKGLQAMDPAPYRVPALKLNVGVQWHPDLGDLAKVIDPRVGVDIMDVFGFIRTLESNPDAAANKQNMQGTWDILQQINIGLNVKLLKFISLNVGLGQGMATAGLGVNLFIIDINAAVGARYKYNEKYEFISESINDFSEVAFSLEVALLRF